MTNKRLDRFLFDETRSSMLNWPQRFNIIHGISREFSHGDHSDHLLGHAWRLYKEGMSIGLMSASLQASCVVSEVIELRWRTYEAKQSTLLSPIFYSFSISI
ncbi:hypothetical protein L1987_15758 [Smallanthus sonchifolius]|uniref:Uncharacterized protein n=1 Tax=Smallanthus sonchifolius TaxID=185202 RepID=A0ACB9J8K8_9ASTR|nr:hypothetical protein L1987_15758 [Smallanthus sonchifolius]